MPIPRSFFHAKTVQESAAWLMPVDRNCLNLILDFISTVYTVYCARCWTVLPGPGLNLISLFTPVTFLSHCYTICHCLFCIIYYIIDNIDSTITVVILCSYFRVEPRGAAEASATFTHGEISLPWLGPYCTFSIVNLSYVELSYP